MESVTVERFGKRIQLYQAFKLVPGRYQFAINSFNFFSNSFHQYHHRAKPEQYLDEKIEDRRELQITHWHSYSQQPFAKSKHWDVMHKPDCQQTERGQHNA